MKRGPKPKPPEQTKRNNLTFRVRDQLREGLEAAAARNGRSVSEEIEHRLERSFMLDEMRSIIREEIGRSVEEAGDGAPADR